jgi:hypothetical protein
MKCVLVGLLVCMHDDVCVFYGLTLSNFIKTEPNKPLPAPIPNRLGQHDCVLLITRCVKYIFFALSLPSNVFNSNPCRRAPTESAFFLLDYKRSVYSGFIVANGILCVVLALAPLSCHHHKINGYVSECVCKLSTWKQLTVTIIARQM